MDDQALAALMADAQRGDREAYRQALRACLPVVAATARRTGVATDRVDDVVQDVLLTIHRALPTYDPSRPFLPWLRAIAQRRAIDTLRMTGRRGAREIQDEIAYLSHAEAVPDALDTLASQARARDLRTAVAGLPPLQRQAVELLGLQERSLEEASAQTGRSKGALKVNLHRALRALRGRMQPDNDV